MEWDITKFDQVLNWTAMGLKVTCRLDRRKYPTGRKITDQEMKLINVERDPFHGEWNYRIRPNT